MADLNISFTETQKSADNPSYVSLVTKNKFVPLITNEEFPELPIKTSSVLYNRSKCINTSHSQSIGNLENISLLNSILFKKNFHGTSEVN